MKLKEFIARNNGDYDVYNDLIAENLPAICGGYVLSDFAKEYYQTALNLDVIEINVDRIVIHCETEEEFEKLHCFLWDLAGYCGASHYDECFIEKDELSYIWRICLKVLGGWPISNDERIDLSLYNTENMGDLAEIIEKCKEKVYPINKEKSE